MNLHPLKCIGQGCIPYTDLAALDNIKNPNKGSSRWFPPPYLQYESRVVEVSMNKNCYRTKTFCAVTLPYRCNSYVSQVSQKWISILVTLGLHRNYIYKEVSQKNNFFYVLWQFLFIATNSVVWKHLSEYLKTTLKPHANSQFWNCKTWTFESSHSENLKST